MDCLMVYKEGTVERQQKGTWSMMGVATEVEEGQS